MKHASQPQSISWFRQHYIDGRLELRPPFQRKPVWTDKQRCSLIESILLDIPIPEVYVQVTTDEAGSASYGVVDGQQRLRTILQFVGLENEADQGAGDDNNLFKLTNLPKTSLYLDKGFGDLMPDQKKKLFSYEICVRLLHTENQAEVEDVFKRLNKFTLPLKPQELRNATFHSAFAKLAEALADDEYWAVNRIVTPASIRRMGDIEFMSDLMIGLIHGPQGGASRILDDYYEMYEGNEDEIPGQAKLRHRFDQALLAVKSVFPDISKVDRWSNRADFYSLFTALGSLLDKHAMPKTTKALGAALEKFATDVDKSLENASASVGTGPRRYARAIEKGSNDKARRAVRHEVLVGLLTPFLKKL
jgi:Protein of unknown function DUF262